MITTAATLTSFGDFFDFQGCSGTPEPSPFNVVLEGGKCVCCGKFTQTQLAGYWTHPDCARQVAEYIRLANAEIPSIRMQIIFSSRRCLEASILSIGSDMDKFQVIRKDVEEKAWEIFKERHPLPWKKASFGGKT